MSQIEDYVYIAKYKSIKINNKEFETPVIKIGTTTRPMKRQEELNSLNGTKNYAEIFFIKLWKIIRKSGKAVERLLHIKFRKKRLNGEWFDNNNNETAQQVEEILNNSNIAEEVSITDNVKPKPKPKPKKTKKVQTKSLPVLTDSKMIIHAFKTVIKQHEKYIEERNRKDKGFSYIGRIKLELLESILEFKRTNTNLKIFLDKFGRGVIIFNKSIQLKEYFEIPIIIYVMPNYISIDFNSTILKVRLGKNSSNIAEPIDLKTYKDVILDKHSIQHRFIDSNTLNELIDYAHTKINEYNLHIDTKGVYVDKKEYKYRLKVKCNCTNPIELANTYEKIQNIVDEMLKTNLENSI